MAGYSAVFGPEPVAAVLKSRGFTIAKRGNRRDVLLPLKSDPPLTGEQFNRFRQLFGATSFRKLVRHITAHGSRATMEQLRKISGDQADEYVAFLVELGVAERSKDQVQLTRSVSNIGPTLEWYVADVCQRNFEGSAE